MRFALVLLMLFIISACSLRSEPVPDLDSALVTTIPNTATQDALPTEDSATSVPIMLSQEAIVCPDAPAIRLIVQSRGRVTDNNDETLNLRNGPGTSFDILVAMNPRDEFMVIDGPTCTGSFAWFRVRYRNTIGWIAEGDLEDYYVEPYLTG